MKNKTPTKKPTAKIPKDMSKMKLTRAETPAQRQTKANLDQQTRAAAAKKRKATKKK